MRGINYRTEDFVEVVLAATAGKGADVILDMIGGDYFDRNLKVAANEGRLVIIAMQGGARAEIKLNVLLTKRLTVAGSTLRARTVKEKGAVADAVHTHVWPFLASGQVRPIIHATFPLAEAAAKFAAQGISKDKRTICYCGGGISATIDLFLLHQLGHDDITLYDASMGEWAKTESLPIETD